MYTAVDLLSIIITNFNYVSFVAEAIASVGGQTYQNMELIVVDDGSTDDSPKAIEQAIAENAQRFSHAELLVQASNAGKLAAINRALDHCSGKYSIILDSDDLLAPNYATRCIKTLVDVREEKPEVGFVYTDCELIDASGAMLDRGRSTAFDREMLNTMSFIPEPAVTLTDILKEAAPYDETIRRGTKHHKWLRIVNNGWTGYHLAEPLFSYRMHQGNLSGIGKRVTGELKNGKRGERILSGYWPTQSTAKVSSA